MCRDGYRTTCKTCGATATCRDVDATGYCPQCDPWTNDDDIELEPLEKS